MIGLGSSPGCYVDGEHVKSGEKPEQQVICLDLEYSSHTREVFEIGVVDYYSGEGLCNVKVKQRCQGADPGQTTPRQPIDPKYYNKVFCQNAGTSLILDIYQIANLLQSFITLETIVLVWPLAGSTCDYFVALWRELTTETFYRLMRTAFIWLIWLRVNFEKERYRRSGSHMSQWRKLWKHFHYLFRPSFP